MSREEHLSIGDVARRTGLSERALRLYEVRGLIAPPRAANGRRVYRPQDLERLMRVRLLKKAGFTLAQIRLMTGDAGAPGDLAALLRARRTALAAERDALAQAVALLDQAITSAEVAAPINAQMLCDLIKSGERTMQENAWKKVYDRYYTENEQAEWARAKTQAFADMDIPAYEQAWADLAQRIEAALPLDPASDKAQGFLAEWNALLEPFMQGASPGMIENAGRLWDNFEDWKEDVEQPISPAVWAFVKEAQARSGD